MKTTGSGKTSGATIVLVRHGKSTHVHEGAWLRPREVSRFEDAYNAAGIRDDSHPSPELIAAATAADVLAASDMIRAIASAKRLAPAREPEVCPLLREITLDPPTWIQLPLPIHVWDFTCHLILSYRLFRGSNHEQLVRARAATDWLVQRATGSARVVAVTHGGFRRLLDAQLVGRGWTRQPGSRSYENWSTWAYTR